MEIQEVLKIYDALTDEQKLDFIAFLKVKFKSEFDNALENFIRLDKKFGK